MKISLAKILETIQTKNVLRQENLTPIEITFIYMGEINMAMLVGLIWLKRMHHF